MGLVLMIGVPLLLFGGAYYLTRGTVRQAPGGTGGQALPTDPAAFRELVVDALQERLPGFMIEQPEDEPLALVAVDTATERRLVLNLTELAKRWQAAMGAGREGEALAHVEAFVRAATGEGAGSDEALDPELVLQGLTVVLSKPGEGPKGGVTRIAGPLVATLVLRRAEGYDALHREEIAALGLSAEEAMARALRNLVQDVEEGIHTAVIEGEISEPKVLVIAPNDPLAASYALVPLLADQMRQSLGSNDLRYHLLDEGNFVVAAAGTDLSEVVDVDGDALAPEPVDPETIVWR